MQQLRSASSASAAADQLLAALPPLMRFLRSQMRRRRGASLTVPQFRALIFVNRNPAATLSALAEHIGISNAAASRMVTLLVRDKLLTRAAHRDDRRAVALGLTARGRARFDAAWSGMHAELTRRLSQLNEIALQNMALSVRILEELFSETSLPAATRRGHARPDAHSQGAR